MERAGDLLKLFLDGKQLEESKKWSAFFHSWKRILGERLAAHARIRDVKNSAVIVEVDHPGWIQMLQMRQKAILKELNRIHPELSVSSLHIQLSERKFWTKEQEERREKAGTPGSPGRAAESREKKRTSEDEDKSTDTPDESTAHALDSIQDGSFRELLKRLEDSIKKRDRDSKH